MAAKITDSVYVGGLSDAVNVAKNYYGFKILCVLEYKPKLEPSNAIHIPAFRLIRNGRALTYSEIVCRKHNECWFEHTVAQLEEDKRRIVAGHYGEYTLKSTTDAASVDVRADKKAFERISEFLTQCELDRQKVLVHCLAGVERSPLVVAYYLSTRNGGDLDAAYEIVKQKHPSTQMRTEWLDN